MLENLKIFFGLVTHNSIAMRDSIPVMLRLCHLFVAETIQKSSNLKICRYKYKGRTVWSLELTLVLVMQLQKVLLHVEQLFTWCVGTRKEDKRLFLRFKTLQETRMSTLKFVNCLSFNDIKSFASSFASKDVPVHVLVNNAGLVENKRTTTPEGFEFNFAVDVLGTYTMTELMLPLLEKASPDAKSSPSPLVECTRRHLLQIFRKIK
ncbi:unnamed protein product [Eruca vesicaria subsp. sativa]|uniref:Uncharacterized protein n=1 Tax=Eruca vesicaria subsp. sativa TaxID=29727 RepID=A0ABC8LID9_ERUVS|nr:unnamed protein product [Eruca vesicaria subsp. sativa]